MTHDLQSTSPRRQTTGIIATLLLAGVLAATFLSRTDSQVDARPVQSAPLPSLTTTLPADPVVHTGQLQNGLRYYLRANKQPLDRAELRLIVNVGSVLENDNQRGFAHLVEHLAFSGTRHFPKQDISAFMQSIGMRFGPSVNATTSYDETVYALQIPTDHPEVIERALLILEDWAHAVSFDSAAIDKERGVVTEEWRLRQGANMRIQMVQFPILLKGSRYVDRAPIGTPEVIQHFTYDELKQFYADWYRPDLMALVVVGDVDVPATEALIKAHFGSIPTSAGPKARPVYAVPAQPGTLYGVATDKEATAATVAVYSKSLPQSQSTVGDYRRELVERLAAGMFSTRLAQVAQRPDAPFLGASAGKGRIVRTVDADILTATVREDGIDRGMAALFAEAERVGRFGFTAPEFERQKTNTLRGFERAIAEKDSTPSATLAAEYTRNFTQDEPFPGLAYEYDLTRRFLPDVTLAEVNALAKAWTPDGNRVVLLTAPDKPGVVVPTVSQMASAMRAAADANLSAYVPPPVAPPIIDRMPPAGTIAKSTTRPAIGIIEWELSNGAKVVLKPTNFKEDEVVFSALGSGGTSLASDADFIPAATAAQVVNSSGVGRFASGDLRNALTGKVVAVSAVMGSLDQGLVGGGSRRDLETLFQLINLYFTQPRRDPTIFEALRSRMKSALANQTATPDFAFGSALTAALSQDHPRARAFTGDSVDLMNLDTSLAFYKSRFADASNFTFIFVGSFDPDTMKPLVEQYLAGLPTLHRGERWRDVGLHSPAGVVERRVEKGTAPKSRTALVFTGPLPGDPALVAALRPLSDLLQTRLHEALREELSGTYVVTATSAAATIPRREYSLSINFGSDPARVDALTARVFDEIAKLKAGGPTTQELADVKAALLRDVETSSRQNSYVLAQLTERYETGEAPETMLQTADSYKAITAGAVRDAARTYLDTARYVKVTLFPEKR